MDVTSTGPGRGARSLEVPSPAFFMAACGCDSRTPENMVAIQVALAMQDVMRAVNTQRTAEGKCTVELGLGVHCAVVRDCHRSRAPELGLVADSFSGDV